MRNFEDFVRLIESNQEALADKAMANAMSIVSNSNIKNFSEELRLAVATALAASGKASLDLTLETLRQYHQWVSQEQ